MEMMKNSIKTFQTFKGLTALPKVGQINRPNEGMQKTKDPMNVC
jgi:hypothetical protein